MTTDFRGVTGEPRRRAIAYIDRVVAINERYGMGTPSDEIYWSAVDSCVAFTERLQRRVR